MFSVLFILNTVRYCTLFTVIETIIHSNKVGTVMRPLRLFEKGLIVTYQHWTAAKLLSSFNISKSLAFSLMVIIFLFLLGLLEESFAVAGRLGVIVRVNSTVLRSQRMYCTTPTTLRYTKYS